MKTPFLSKNRRFFAACLLVLLAGIMTGAFLVPLYQTSALVGSDFNAGHIIDDVIFTNSTAMSINDIQNFLNAQLPNCDTYGAINITYWYNPSDGYASASYPDPKGGSSQVTTSRAIYGQRYDSYNGTTMAAAPYICLKSYVENPSTGANNLQNPSASVSGGETAAQIIYNAAQQYQINPEVILTTLQKEQGLVTDDWPWTYEYTEAMGFNCPDTGGCSGFAGFYQQVDAATKQFRNYLNNPNNFNYVVGSNSVAYSPSCSGPVINIQNQATAALYDYTPYQPDSNVLNNTNPTGSSSGPGGVTGDSCASYGNRNFWWYFNSWFGASLASAYTWQYAGQALYTDSSMSTPVAENALVSGIRYYAVVYAKNVGSVTWQQNKINLGTSQPGDRTSAFYDSSWLAPNRPATLDQTSVVPGATGSFSFWITAPQAPNTYHEYFNLVAENITWFNDLGLNWALGVSPQRYTWEYQGQQAYTDQSKNTQANLSNINPGMRYFLTLTAKNTGNMTWQQGKVNLGTSQPGDRTSAFYDSSWLAPNRPATLDQTSVVPGATGSFSFWVEAPLNAGGNFKEYFNLVDEGVAWMNDLGQYYAFNVQSPNYSWQLISQGLYTDATMSTSAPSQLSESSAYYASITIKNAGNVIWYKNKVNLGTSNPGDRTSIFAANSWLSPNRPATMQQSLANPGQTATYNFWVQTPNYSGNYKEYFNFVADGITWLTDIGMYYQLNVN